jgi:3-hydroxybutyrate dehydrogenase
MLAVVKEDIEMVKKTALITGAASGIGKACATRLSRDGMAVVIADLNFEMATDTAREINSNDGYGHAMAVRMDVTKEDEVNQGIDLCVREFGGIDVLISNAGIQIVRPFEAYSYADWKKMMAIHADGAFLSTKAAYAKMKESDRGGQIIFMGSIHSHAASPLKAAYCFAKHGVLGLCRVIAIEGAPYGIHSYTICPGFVRTALVEKQIPEQARELGITEEEVVRDVMLKNTVDGEFTTVAEVADIVHFVANDSKGAFTGQSFNVTHGWRMQ